MSTQESFPHAALRQEIRREADALPVSATAAPAAATTPAELPLDHPQRLRYALQEFVPIHNEAFVDLAYRCLLKRSPDPAGMVECLQRLAAGDSKIAILGDIRWSLEGRGHAVEVTGLAPRYRFWRLTRLPLVGGLIERLALVWGLPEIAREQRRLGQALARSDSGAETAELAAQVRELREHVLVLQAELRRRTS
ncbi:hypothetical protein [Tahibacter amnicola]|uniref:DUF4214 domain-containing protein n=1 Tax=Tahibacter amnicola TaxID=2976241 RepID=A0ABY6BJF5_9GAMM|nr:hypothetical protein [Tahibacter amnicola]UXI67962.1 hypothetical protein N4264_25080 [Tahibacter amnicola]